jgi:predicted ArsR family transcriptional regulator
MNETHRQLALRELELLEYLRKEIGDRVLDLIERFEDARMERLWAGMEDHDRSASSLAHVLWEGMGGEAGFESVVDRSAPGRVAIECTRCPFADIARARGLETVAYARYCAGDWGIARGWNSSIKLTRTKTLMQGDSCCDHVYLETESRE